MDRAYPNGRDYYPQHDGALREAMTQARDQMVKLDALIEEIEAEALAISNQEGDLKTVCAWCEPGRDEPGITHGICERHAAEMTEEARHDAGAG